MSEMQRRLTPFATLALFAALAFFAWKSGRAVYQNGPGLDIREEGGAVVLRWTHEIEAPMAARVAAAFEEWKDRTDRFIIDLHSPGGSIIEGRLVIDEIARMKETHRVESRVRAHARCLSMCVPIYMQGDRRTAGASAIFMFHEPTTRDVFTEERIERPGFEQRHESERFFERYFAASEMDPEWRERLRAAWNGRDLWFTGKELVDQRSGVVEELE